MALRDWNELREAAIQGYADAVYCLATIEVVERSNKPSTIDQLNKNKAWQAARLLRDSALFRLHLFVCRAFASATHDDDLHLRAAVNFLRDHMHEEIHPQRRYQLSEAILLFSQLEIDPRLKRLKRMRDKVLAHMARYDETQPGKPTYNDLFSFTRETTQIWEKLSFGAATVMIELEHQVEEYRKSSNAFWERWEPTCRNNL